jgi:hypothetical protein
MAVSINHDNTHSGFVYFDPGGCSLCEAVADLEAICKHGGCSPWSDEASDEAECVYLIHNIKEMHNPPSYEYYDFHEGW